MIELFGSPAGRALTVNNRTAAEMQPCSKSNNSTNSSSSNIASSISQQPPLSQQPLYHPLQNCGFSGTCSTICSVGLNHNHTNPSTASNNFVETSDLIRYRSNNHPQLHHHQTTNYSNNNGRTNSKIAKIWKLFDEDRIRKTSLGSSSNHHSRSSTSTNTGISGSDIFSRCQSTRRKSSSIQSEEKSTKDLYNEAAQLLGIKCTLSDSCRCIDCQSQYFDCDDFDSYSEYSDKSYDTEDNFAVNQSYYCSGGNIQSQRQHEMIDVCHHDDEEEQDVVGSTVHSQVTSNESSSSYANQQRHLRGVNVANVRDGDENEDDNGNNKNDQYLLDDASHELPHPVGGNVHRNPTVSSHAAAGGIQCRKSNGDCEIIGPTKQQIRPSSPGDDVGPSNSGRDYASAGEINEPETNGNSIA
ncbi:mediator of RNA polymerase II transcription subunit 2 isoform X2 [Aedes aegypti]|nr:mediator of RNA polymerase II transcription subunit 2 isoform X2 [Aedes aegypti]XP_021699386.1 mediator of RNA polymerase II transcription subunit 2 isoform X2 [Aedes aegypti]XP_021699387.1 mediator of RNA polymerase II transcription subunit 2 isoform X2 [Aedes aegypti]